MRPEKAAADAVTFLHSYTLGCRFMTHQGTSLTALRWMQYTFGRIVVPLYHYLVNYTVPYTSFIHE